LRVRDPESGGGIEPKSVITPTIRASANNKEIKSPKLDSSRTISPYFDLNGEARTVGAKQNSPIFPPA
jgi:hypothetical protein